MKSLWLSVFLFILSGCSLENLFLSQEIDKITIVKQTAFTKHNRAYFARKDLQPVWNNKRYLFLYHPKNGDLLLILHKHRGFLVYHFFKPGIKPRNISQGSIMSIIRLFAKKGYRHINLYSEGFVLRTGLRRYKGTKTLLIDVTDYRMLQKQYREAIHTYNAQKVYKVRETLPKGMIYQYLHNTYAEASTDLQKKALKEIARKLHIPLSDNQSSVATNIETAQQQEVSFSYDYYRYHASEDELKALLHDPTRLHELEDQQYAVLKHRLEALEDKNILENGSIEALIEAYKTNKDPRFKKRILDLMKEKHETPN